jgi:purine nucleosidase/pyrimidine-specific ribonucleoside hydrolase
MNRFWKGILITSGILAFLLIMIWPMAPLWQRLGAKPKCIKGTWPDLRLTDCAVVEATVATIPLPQTGADGPIPLIVDDDGSPDGTIALLYFLRNPRFEVKAVTISNGEAHPEKFAPKVAKILAAFGRADIPVGYGKDSPLAGENAFPDAWRQASDDFWGLSLPQAESPFQPVPAAKLIAETISKSDRPVTVFVSGSHTNMAEALRLEPSIAEKIGDVFIMGGGVNVPGNIHSDWPALKNETAEWNIWVDPQAAKEVFESGLRLHLIPLDATRQVGWRQTDIRAWESKSSPESGLAHDLGQWMLDNWSPEGVMIWDLVAALQATDQALCPEVQMALEVVTTPGPEEGRTKTVNGPANMAVCLEPDPALVKALAASVFKQP